MNPACNGLLAAACSPPLAGTGIVTQQDTGLRNLYRYYSCYSSDWKSHCAAEHYKCALTDLNLVLSQQGATNMKRTGCKRVLRSMTVEI